MSDNGFNSIAQAMLKQKQMMDELEYENRELRRQIADIRAGHGIFIEVAGQRFPLKGVITVAQPPAPTQVAQPVPPTQVAQPDFSPSPATSSLPAEPVSQVGESAESVEAAPTMELAPAADTSVESVEKEEEKEKEKEKAPTFLEEIMLDEFVAASTSPMSVWNGPVNKKEEPIDEEQKAALRRELMGSFLLE